MSFLDNMVDLICLYLLIDFVFFFVILSSSLTNVDTKNNKSSENLRILIIFMESVFLIGWLIRLI